ncbi:T cell receptor alpha chain MC.7.G5-like [Girardinichthys multiradiatus]|uniref:T cell receptor alpha chain MC.7.G5-like n=1 Tax=Girardinichthys multiradiatus TaxID=208333 RepID=UPI001FAD9053|nr:T cell receptor alpha chain MC.7.G5-like [Girardinichthys multiradiatus]
MTVLWITLLLLHQGYTLVPLVTVELGQSVILTCAFARKYQSNTWLYWYKQNAGDTLNLIVKQQKSIIPKYGPQFPASRFSVTYSGDSSNLTISSTVQSDEGMYHCSEMDTLESIWSGTYLSIKGNIKRTSSYTVVQQSVSSDPSRLTDSETLQCSLLSDSENTTCSGDPSVFWFRGRPDKSSPDFIYTDGEKAENCENRSDSQKRCVYNFSKNVSSSDAWTYYCAVVTCGQILFANKMNLNIDKTNNINVLVVTIICLIISVIGNVVSICKALLHRGYPTLAKKETM